MHAQFFIQVDDQSRSVAHTADWYAYMWLWKSTPYSVGTFYGGKGHLRLVLALLSLATPRPASPNDALLALTPERGRSATPWTRRVSNRLYQLF
jgi:hypothetical protein